MRILITGGSGFIGTNLVAHYIKKGVAVLNLDINPPRNPAQKDVWVRGDITDSNATNSIIRGFSPDYCFHLAARTDLRGGGIHDYAANTMGVKSLIDALKGCPSLKLTVFASSMLVCRIGYRPTGEMDYCPTTPYGESKVEGERIVRERATGKLNWVIVRPTSIWGPWFGTPYRDFFNAVQRGVYIHPRGMRIRRSYGFVLNTVFQLEQLRAYGGGNLLGKTVYIADYEPIELHEWAARIQQRLNTRPISEWPLPLFRLGALLGDVFKKMGYHSFPLTTFRLRNLLTESVLDVSPLFELTGQLPYSAQEGVNLTCDWLTSEGGN